MKRQKEWDFYFNHKSILIFYPKLYIKMILNSVMKDMYIFFLFFMKKLCKMAIIYKL